MQIDPITRDVTQDLSNDELRTRLYAVDTTNNLRNVDAAELGNAAASADVSLLTHMSRALDSQGLDELVSRLTDSTGTQVDPATNTDQPNFFDDDILDVDLTNSDYSSGEVNVRGTSDTVIKVRSESANTFTVTLQWTDGSGNVLYEQQPPEATDVSDANLTFNTSSDNLIVTITDTSGAGSNIINGTVHAT